MVGQPEVRGAGPAAGEAVVSACPPVSSTPRCGGVPAGRGGLGAAALSALLLAVCWGCARARVTRSTGPARWTGLGVSLLLPAGDWRVEEVQPGEVAAFRHLSSGLEAAIIRRGGGGDVSPEVLLADLFVHFEEKRRMGRGSRPLAGGRMAECADYMVRVEDREVFVRACVVQHGEAAYRLAAWGAASRGAEVTDLSDQLLDGLAFSGEDAGP